MRNHLIKYVKIAVCGALILSLVSPSFASLSASDGSAFVTKAEFDSAMADFNSRLTTFEAGINSKIDSQVTSYLDRNGIWNGSVQTLKNNTGGSLGVYNSNTNVTAYAGRFGDVYNPQADWDTDPNRPVRRALPYEGIDTLIIEQISKTGLMVVDMVIRTSCRNYIHEDASDSKAFRIATANKSDGHILNEFFSMTLRAALTIDGEEKYSWRQIKDWIVSSSLSIDRDEDVKAYFFVQKGQGLVLTTKTEISGKIGNWDGKYADGYNNFWQKLPVIEKVVVY